jgi:hypothetical protein
MSGTTTKSRDNTGHPQGAIRDSMLNLNRAIADLETVRANYVYTFANDVLTPTTAVVATIASAVKITATITYSNGGAVKTKAAADPMWTLGTGTSGTAVVTAFVQKYLLGFNAAGTAVVYEGTQAATAVAVVLPSVATLSAAGITVVETLTVTNTSGSNFVPGTTLLSAAGIAATFLSGIDPLFLTQATALTASQIGNENGTAQTS